MTALVRKLENFVRFSPGERRTLEELAELPGRRVAPRRELVSEGDRPTSVLLIVEGWAVRWKALADGRRQILSLFLPGDLCDAHAYLLNEMDHSIGAITRVRVAEIPRDTFEQLAQLSDRVSQSIWWSELVSNSIQREWALNLGQRTAYERIAHLLCEAFVRLKAVGLTNGDSCEFPLVQQDLGDATGLTAVHVNRTLQELRREGLIVLHSRRLTIPDFPRLRDVALFNPNYLHLRREGAHLDAND